MQKSKSKITYIAVMTIGIIAIGIMVLKITGMFDISSLFHPSYASSEKQDRLGGYFIDEWVSEPFGDLDVTAVISAYDNKFVRIALHSDSEKFDDCNFDWFYQDSGEIDISEITYNDYGKWLDGGRNIETGMVYTAFVIPLDCEKVFLDGIEFMPQKASVNTTKGEKQFKVCTLTYFEKGLENHEFILIDKGGSEHLITIK